MGEVYRAVHAGLGTTVALKLVRPEWLGSPEAGRRFLREIPAAAKVDHPHVVRSVDAGEAGGRLYLALEYVDGEDLAAAVRKRGPLSLEEVLRVGLELGLALEHLHARGLVHRDIKPSNLIRDRKTGSVKLLDLGLSRVDAAAREADESTMTRHGAVLGTPDFIAPEQALDARRADIRSDLYSTGCTLFYLLTGAPPYPGGTAVEKMIRHHQEPTPLASSKRPGLPEGLSAILAKLMAKRPDDRYATPTEMVRALTEFLTPAPPPPPPPPPFADLTRSRPSVPPPPPRRRPPSRRRPLVWAGAATLALLGVVAALWPRREAPPPATAPARTAAREGWDGPAPTRFGVPAVVIGGPRRRHGGAATAVAVTPDGTRAVSAGADRVARVWDVGATVSPLRELTGHSTPLTSVAVSPSGRRAAACSAFATPDGIGIGFERALRVWETATGRELLALDHNTGGWTISALFPPDERFVLAGHYAAVSLWDLAERRQVRVYRSPVHLDWVNAMALSPDGKTLYAASNRRDAVQAWDYETANHRRAFDGHTGTVVALAVAPDGRRLASVGSDRTVRVWDAATGAAVRVISGTVPATGVAWDAAGRELAATWADGSLRWYDAETGAEKRRAEGHVGSVTGLALPPGRGFALTSGADGSVRKWDCRTAKELDPLPPQLPVARLAFAEAALVALPDFGPPVHFDLKTGRAEPPGWAASEWRSVALSADGRRTLAQLHDQFGRHAAGAVEPLPLRDGRFALPAAADADAGRFVYAARDTTKVVCADAASARSSEFDAGPDLWCLAVSPDGKRLVAGHRDGRVVLRDLPGGAVIGEHSLGSASVAAASFAPDGSRAYIAAGGEVWELAATGSPRLIGGFRDAPLTAVATDGRRVAAGAADGQLAVWPVGKGAAMAAKTAWPVRALAFAPDGRGLAAGFGNGVVAAYRFPEETKTPR